MNIKKKGRIILDKLSKTYGAENIIKLEAKIRFNKTINLEKPKTLSDKICYLEYKVNNPMTITCSDKYEVRNYVKLKGLEDILVPLVGSGIYINVNDIEFDRLPNKFVLKATYGCKMNIICKNKNTLNIENTKQILDSWLQKGFNRENLEPHYKKIKKRIMCEEYLEGATSIIDYKIHCMNGEPKFILTCTERDKDLKLNLYDLEWNPIYGICGKHKNSKEIDKPSKLNEMIKIAKILAAGFDFVRIDLYQINEKIYFGEMTFTPDGGILSYYTKEFDKEMGECLRITPKYENLGKKK